MQNAILYTALIVTFITISLFVAKIGSICEQFVLQMPPIVMMDTIAYIPYDSNQQSMPQFPNNQPVITAAANPATTAVTKAAANPTTTAVTKAAANPTTTAVTKAAANPASKLVKYSGTTTGVDEQLMVPNEIAGFTLTHFWSDDFKGPELDKTKWDVMEGDGTDYYNKGFFLEEQQCYTSSADNLSVKDNKLVITAKAGGTCINSKTRSNGDGSVTSARITSKQKFGWTGQEGNSTPILITTRAKLPMAKSSFPAIWLISMVEDQPYSLGKGMYGDFPDSGEIDIVEHVNNHVNIYSGLHVKPFTDQTGKKISKISMPFETPANEWHLYQLYWDARSIKIWVDGNIVLNAKPDMWNKSYGVDSIAPFDKQMHLVINLAVDGEWVKYDMTKDSNNRAKTTTEALPFQMEVDYIYVHKVTK